MLWTMIKNNLKLMLRSKWILGIMILGPIITIAALSSAFSSIMKTQSEAGSFQVGYSLEENSPYAPYLEVLVQQAKEQKVEFVEYRSSNPEQQLQEENVAVFVSFGSKDYTVYTSKDHDLEASITKFILYQMFHANGSIIEVPSKEIEFISIPDSTEYYGKIEIIYFVWTGMFVISTVVISERKNRIQRRFKIAPVGHLQLYLAKFIPCFLALTIITTVSTLLSTFIFDLHWGCYLKTIGILFLGSAAVSAVAVVLFYLTPNIALAIVIEFVGVWVMGFFGGTFESYQYSSIPEVLKKSSPIYHMNRALVEYETNGASDYGSSAVLFLGIILVVATIIGSILMKRRMEDR